MSDPGNRSYTEQEPNVTDDGQPRCTYVHPLFGQRCTYEAGHHVDVFKRLFKPPLESGHGNGAEEWVVRP